MSQNCLFLVCSPYFDGIGILFEEMVVEKMNGNNIHVLDAVVPGLFPRIRNFNFTSFLLWRYWRRRQFIGSLNARISYTDLKKIVPTATDKIDEDLNSITLAVLNDDAVCNGITGSQIPDYIAVHKDATARNLGRIRKALLGLLEKQNIDKVFIFNGRNPVARLLERLCIEKDIDTVFLEYFGTRNNRMTYLRLPFSMFEFDRFGNWIKDCYAAAGSDREAIAEAALNDRIKNLDPLMRSWDLEGGETVSSITEELQHDSSRPVVSFFFSSEDEYPAIRKSRYGLPDPTKQYETFLQICKGILTRGLQDRYDWEIKLHPRYTAETDKLSEAKRAWRAAIEQSRNMGLSIKEHAPTSSAYPVIARSALVVSYGSTAWEACYLGKPSVLLGPNLFASHGCSYNADSVETLLDYIESIPPALPKETTYPYAWAKSELGIVPHQFKQFDRRAQKLGRLWSRLANRFVVQDD